MDSPKGARGVQLAGCSTSETAEVVAFAVQLKTEDAVDELYFEADEKPVRRLAWPPDRLGVDREI